MKEVYTIGTIRMGVDWDESNINLSFIDTADAGSFSPAVIAFVGQAVSEYRGQLLTQQTVDEVKLKIRGSLNKCLQDITSHCFDRGPYWVVVFEGRVRKDLHDMPTPAFDGSTIDAGGIHCRIHIAPEETLPGVTLRGQDVPQELSDLVTDYFHKKYRKDPSVDEAKQKVMDSGRFVEKYLDYMYEYWETLVRDDRH